MNQRQLILQAALASMLGKINAIMLASGYCGESIKNDFGRRPEWLVIIAAPGWSDNAGDFFLRKIT